MTETAISPLRRRMIEDMTVRNFVEKTRNASIRHVKRLAAFLGRSPDTASSEDLQRFQFHLTESGVTPPSINAAVAAWRRCARPGGSSTPSARSPGRRRCWPTWHATRTVSRSRTAG